MSLFRSITRMITDPPPQHIFEFSDAGIAFAQGELTGFEGLPEGALEVSPLEDNLKQPDVILRAVEKIAPAGSHRKRRPAAVILPDYAARVSVLDFDSFPTAAEEQAQLVRFRVKKTVPFDIDSAAVSYFAQPAAGKRVEVVAVTVPIEILAKYEALFRQAQFHPGEVTTATLAALNLYRDPEVAVLAKLAGRILTVAVVAQGRLKLFRCLSLEEASEEEILAVLHPTFAYVEDELGVKVAKLVLCGFDHPPAGLEVAAEPLRSRFGVPNAYNAGLIGYLEGAQA